jgi:DNA-directed RNA polymerase
MRELDKNNNLPVKLPIFLDATCSGIQHLAALIRDTELASKVNLTASKLDQGPEDIYDSLRVPINEEIRRVGREEILYSNLAIVDLTRDIIKTPIMTKTYNVSRRGITDQLINKVTSDKLENSNNNNNNKTNNKNSTNFNKIMYKAPTIIPGQVKLLIFT